MLIILKLNRLMNYLKYYFILIFILISDICYSQIYKNKTIVVYGGIALNFGTKVNRIGITTGGLYVDNSFQINSKAILYYNLNTFGPKHHGPEFQFSLGSVYGFGKKDSINNPFISSIGNQTKKMNSIGFCYNVYLDNIKTSQGTGTLALEIHNFQIVHENDMWGEPHSDKYRSAGVLLSYRIENTLIALNTTLWHGDAFANGYVKHLDTDYPARFGYKDLSNVPYGKISHGILSLQIEHSFCDYQISQINIGIDSEHVRNILQNKMIHDMPFLPEKYIGYKLANYPMLDCDGNPYLYQSNQKIRPSTLWLNLSSNSGIFY